jgi:substrate import-associated zinc metallohydrolase lipoprotein
MKAIQSIILIFTASLLFSCGEEALREPETLITDDGNPELNAWIKEHFTDPYNISINYTWKNAGSDQGVDLVPPNEEVIQPFLKILLKAWAQPYIATSPDSSLFLKESTLREFRLFGKNHSAAAATASNGYLITMYSIDNFVPNTLGKYSKSLLLNYFSTVHHEYGHILNQMRKYDEAFKIISGSDYKADIGAYTRVEALNWGFITNYAMSAHGEDFVEVLSVYLTSTQTEWNTLVGRANAVGQDRLKRKLQMVADYMNTNYKIDIQTLRDNILTAIDDVANGNIEIDNDL